MNEDPTVIEYKITILEEAIRNAKDEYDEYRKMSSIDRTEIKACVANIKLTVEKLRGEHIAEVAKITKDLQINRALLMLIIISILGMAFKLFQSSPVVVP